LTEKGEADYGVVPMENSTEGVVTYTLDTFMSSDLKILAEVSLPIAHYLLSKSPREAIRRVYSHPQAVAQTRRWLEENLPAAEIVEVASTARAAEMAAGEAGTAAVAPQLAAEVYRLDIIASHIEDMTANVTRFAVIGRTMANPTGRDRTALMFCLQDRVGALHDALQIIKRRGISLSMITSRPSRTQLWDWVFFAEFSGHPKDEAVAEMLDDLRRECAFMKVLGAWPAAQTPTL
ncbi:MAG: prephenate dehydratase, partial [Bacteroidetes bacterium]|nr:prephenate dehydratase [Bacteroidota bacterium]